MVETVAQKEHLYRLIISQLRYDGYDGVATQLQQAFVGMQSVSPSERLFRIAVAGMQAEGEVLGGPSHKPDPVDACLNLEFDNEDQKTSPTPAIYETLYVTSHKGPCRAATFSPDGQLAATGSGDASIKVLDVDRMVAKQNKGTEDIHPVIRTFYDHNETVTALSFHPTRQVLASGSEDCTVKLFDHSKSAVKKAFRSFQESQPVRALAFHSSGEYLLVGTTHPTLRLYNVQTSQCYVSCNPKDQHEAALTSLAYAPDSKIYASASKDGSIKLWDTISNRCINTFSSAHNGAEVSSVCFSKNSKYMLSSGKDSNAFLWELSTGRVVCVYKGATQSALNTAAIFNHTEDYVLMADERTTTVASWDSRTADMQRLLSSGHSNAIQCISHSPTLAAFISGSDDFRIRFWYHPAGVVQA